MRAALAFTDVVLRTLVRDRAALFFTLVLPVAVIVIMGTTFGKLLGGRTDLGVVQRDRGPLAGRVVGALRATDGVRVHEYRDLEAMRRAIRRPVTVVAGVVVPPGLDRALRAGRPAAVGFVADQASQAGLNARLAVQGILDPVAARIGAARIISAGAGGTLAADLALADRLAGTGGVTVRLDDVGSAHVTTLNRFSRTALQNLVLFVFLNAMASAVLIVSARRQGILRRAIATRTPVAVVLLGLGLGWLVLALVQSALIVLVGAVLFDVRWGDPIAAALLVGVFALVGCGAGLLVGAVGRDEDRVSAITPIIGIVLGALGGCMVPLELFPPGMRAVAHAVPHYWAVRAWQQLIFDGAGVGTIAPALAELAATAAVLIALATVLLRRQLTGR